MDVMREQMAFLLAQGLYDSAELLGHFLVSASWATLDQQAPLRADDLILLADALKGRGEHRRALNLYRRALQLCRVAATPTPAQRSSGTSKASQPGKGAPAAAPAFGDAQEGELKYKMTECHLALKEPRAALAELESVPSRARTLRINLCLAKLYHHTGYDRAAVACYRECLRQCPYVLDAVIALAQLGVRANEIHPYLPQKAGGGKGGDQYDPSKWMPVLAEAHCAMAAHNYKSAGSSFLQLNNTLPENLHLLNNVARVQTALNNPTEAIHTFQKARAADACAVDSMDEYALLVGQRDHADTRELGRLVHELLQNGPKRPEAWVGSAVYWEAKGDKVRALSYVEKSLRADERHVLGYLVKGHLSMSLSRLDAAVASYRKAHSLRPDLRAYQGLVRAYLAGAKHKEALVQAREAAKAMPESAAALVLVGDVYSQGQDSRDKARKCYESALKLDPSCLEAVLSLAELHQLENHSEEAISLLQRFLRNCSNDALHAKLAQVFVAVQKYGEALTHYSAAISMNPLNEAARKGLERLDKLMKGVDPDAEEEEEEVAEAEEADNEQDEQEFM